MFDRIVAITLIILLFPILFIVACLVYVLSGAPIIFKQRRCGYQLVEFNIYKFRTMKINDGSLITEIKDDRITSIGQIMRKLRLDELPQLINVVMGNMVFVGPRQEVPEIVHIHPNYFNYLETYKPGITDLNSIIFKDESKVFQVTSLEDYMKNVLPIKSKLINQNSQKFSKYHQIIIILISLVSLFNHKLSLHIISKLFLSSSNVKIRKKLNCLLSEKIF